MSVLLLTSCGQGEDDGDISLSLPDGSSSLREQVLLPTSLERIKSRGELIIITTNTPTTYYFDRDNQLVGPEYDMTQAFAASLQVDVVYKVYDSVAEVLQALRDNEGDIAAAGLTVTDGRKIEFSFSSSYQKTNE
ncbi:MAG: transporter substrate-binding domain-containing protein, partial [Thiotrichaceae bacterium]|nr:transporter substrate-binding domain-containing protein [Thiotrichaceae bacterium]